MAPHVVIDRQGPVTVLAGFSGHGSTFGSVIGALAADLVGGAAGPTRVRTDRFRTDCTGDLHTMKPPLDDLQVRLVDGNDPVLAPVLADLEREYTARYPGYDVTAEMRLHPPAEFAPPAGAFLVLHLAGELVGAGAYRRYAEGTAELKRVWTSGRHRRRGLGRRTVLALEAHAFAAGYRRLYLTTGPRQPEARALYLSLGYTPVGDHDALVSSADAPLPFVKALAEERPA